MRNVISILLICASIPRILCAADINDLLASKTLECYFPQGVVGDWTNKGLNIQSDKMSGSIHFDNIDIKQGTAKIIGNTGTSNVFLKASLSGITFIEATQSGNLILTTVFPKRMGNNFVANPPDIGPLHTIQEGFVAVMSRHIFLINSPFTAQYYGFCFKKE